MNAAAGTASRVAAARVLAAWEEGNGYLADLLERFPGAEKLSPRDRKLWYATVQQVVRNLLPLDETIDALCSARPPARGSLVRQVLRISLAHLFYFDRIPEYAVLHQAAETLRRLGRSRSAGFVNALLRRALREKRSLPPFVAGDGSEAWSRRYSVPPWLVERWLNFRGREWAEAVCRGSARIPAVFARTNRLRATPAALRDALEKEGAEPRPVPGRPGFFRLAPGFSPASSPASAAGLFQVQDPSTAAAAELLAPVPGETIADLCSAPGGKLGAAVELMRDRGVVFAADVSPDRLEPLRENVSRLGITSARILEYDLLGEESFPGPPCDGILLDVPCSNTGVLARRLDVRWRLRPGDIPRLAARGLAMLERAALLLKPGGRLVYSTCSLENEENRGTVEAFLASRPEWEAVAVEEGAPNDNGDGYFAARLEKRGG